MEQKSLYLQVNENGEVSLFPDDGRYEEIVDAICELCGKCREKENFRKIGCPIGWCG